jgi:hypothetical protein
MSITDMTGVASLFPRHSGPTVLYLNFDGNSSQGVSAFQSTTGNRNRDIQEIMYRTAEIFSPFDVQVKRMFGNGSYDSSSNGNTTIFIGDKSSNGTGANNKAYAGTPWGYADFPGDVKGITHRPNSDAYDLAYVDPVYGASNSSWGNQQISRAIAHEAGHTFGLAHVLSSPDPEIMSYDSSNVRFVNKTFNITDLNYNGTSTVHDPGHAPKWHIHIPLPFGGGIDFPVPITTQNSYTFLQTTLGARVTSGDFANIADSGAVDGSYVDGFKPSVGVGSSIIGGIQRAGDYDVFTLSTPTSRSVVIDVKKLAGSRLDPVVMVFDSSGQNLLAFDDDSGGSLNSHLVFSAVGGVNYQIVVGSWSGNSAGSYQLTVNNLFRLPFATALRPVNLRLVQPLRESLEPLQLTPESFAAVSKSSALRSLAVDRVFFRHGPTATLEPGDLHPGSVGNHLPPQGDTPSSDNHSSSDLLRSLSDADLDALAHRLAQLLHLGHHHHRRHRHR